MIDRTVRRLDAFLARAEDLTLFALVFAILAGVLATFGQQAFAAPTARGIAAVVVSGFLVAGLMRWRDRRAEWLGLGALVAVAAILREVTGLDPLLRACLLWLAWIGGSAATRDGRHVFIGRRRAGRVAAALGAVIALGLLPAAWRYVSDAGGDPALVTLHPGAIPVPAALAKAALPAGLLLIGLRHVLLVVRVPTPVRVEA